MRVALVLTLLLSWYASGFQIWHLFWVGATEYKMNCRWPGLNIQKAVSLCYVHYCQEIHQKQNGSILSTDSRIYTQTRLFLKVPSWWLSLSSRHHGALWALYGLRAILFFRLASGLCHKLISVYILTYAWLILQGSSTQQSLSIVREKQQPQPLLLLVTTEFLCLFVLSITN